jgi:mycothiol synthase
MPATTDTWLRLGEAPPLSGLRFRRPRGDERSELSTDLWVVAWDGNEVAGSVQPWIWPDENERQGVHRGWLESISVRRPWRRRGLARAMTAEALRRLKAAGMKEAMLGVEAADPTGALDLCVGLGFEIDRRGRHFGWPTASGGQP